VQLKGVEMSRGYFSARIDFGADVFDGSSLWLEIAVCPHSEFPVKKTTLMPRQAVGGVPYAIRATYFDGTVDVSRITGLLGQGYTVSFPQVLYNEATVAIYGDYFNWQSRVVVTVGPGVDIDRVAGFDPQGRPKDSPGFAMEHPFVFEVGGAAAEELKHYYAIYPASDLAYAIIFVPSSPGEMALGLFVYMLKLERHEPGIDGRTRFVFSIARVPDRLLSMAIGTDVGYGDFGSEGSYNPATDRRVEIEGLPSSFYPSVEEDAVNRKLTFVYSIEEGAGIFYWVKDIVEGTGLPRDLSVVRLDGNGDTAERVDYSGCFPLKYEIFEGFGLDTKLRARVVVSYNTRQPM